MLFLIHNHTSPSLLYRLDVINMNRQPFQSMATEGYGRAEERSFYGKYQQEGCFLFLSMNCVLHPLSVWCPSPQPFFSQICFIFKIKRLYLGVLQMLLNHRGWYGKFSLWKLSAGWTSYPTLCCNQRSTEERLISWAFASVFLNHT